MQLALRRVQPYVDRSVAHCSGSIINSDAAAEDVTSLNSSSKSGGAITQQDSRDSNTKAPPLRGGRVQTSPRDEFKFVGERWTCPVTVPDWCHGGGPAAPSQDYINLLVRRTNRPDCIADPQALAAAKECEKQGLVQLLELEYCNRQSGIKLKELFERPSVVSGTQMPVIIVSVHLLECRPLGKAGKGEGVVSNWWVLPTVDGALGEQLSPQAAPQQLREPFPGSAKPRWISATKKQMQVSVLAGVMSWVLQHVRQLAPQQRPGFLELLPACPQLDAVQQAVEAQQQGGGLAADQMAVNIGG